MDTLNDIWKEVLSLCKKEVSDVIYNMWLSPLEFYKLKDDTAVFIINAEFKKSIILSKFSQMLKRNFKEVIGFDVEIDVIVDKALDDNNKSISTNVTNNSLSDTTLDNDDKNIIPKTEEKKSENKEEYTFDSFVVGKSNIFAYTVAKRIIESPENHYNPLLIYGNSGLGKTHLLFAIYNALKKKNPNDVIIYTTGESFLNEIVECIAKKTTSYFHNKYRNIDALLVDDIQIIQRGDTAQEEFFHTFNALDQAGKIIVLTSDVPPKNMTILDDRLKTRYEMGILADIQPPDIETRKAILKRKCQSLNISLNENTIDYIANKVKSNIRQLEGTVKKIEAYKKVYGYTPNIEQVQNIVKDVSSDSLNSSAIISNAFSVVSNIMGVTEEELKSKNRSANIALARYTCMYLIKTIDDTTLKDVGDIFNKDHASVIHAIKKIEEKMESNQNFKNMIENMIKDIKEMGNNK